MSKYGFWILLLACLLAIGTLYALEVRKSVQELATTSDRIRSHAQDAMAALPAAVGRRSKSGLLEQQALVESQRSDLQKFFDERDAAHLDLWFPNLRTPWKSAPLVDDFQRQYDLAQDRLSREASRLLSEAGVSDVSIRLMSPAPLTASSFVEKKDLIAEMRRRQREFWVQDHLVLAFARQGAWLARPLRGGDSMGVTSGGGGEAVFERFRFDVQVLAKPERVLEVLHALDAPFVYVTEDGQRFDVALNAIVDNVAVRIRDLDAEQVKKSDSEPPVLVSFYLTILDFQPKKGS